jgi:hypothetical protein
MGVKSELSPKEHRPKISKNRALRKTLVPLMEEVTR